MASCGSNVAPIFLRLALGLTFLWAGWNKTFNTFEVQGEAAAQLANLGVITPPAPAVTPAPAVLPVPAPSTTPPARPDPAPVSADPARSDPAPSDPAPSDPASSEPTAPITPVLPTQPEPGQGDPDQVPSSPEEPAPARELAPTSPSATPPAPPTPPTRPSELVNVEPMASVVQVTMNLAPITYMASDFPEPQKVRALYRLVPTITNAAAPKANDAGKSPMPLLPAAVNQGRWPVYMAWAVALTELIGGVFFLVGFLGRLAGFMNAGVMAGALWLTQFGPAIQAGTAKLGFLPAYGKDGTLGLWDINAAGTPVYAMPLWQLMLLCACLAIMVLGSGALSIDSLFRRSHSPVTKDEA